MEKHLVTVEFRYTDNSKEESDYKSKTVTIGVFDTFDSAIIEGNKALEVFEKHFKLNPNWNKKERFSKNGGCFRTPNRLVTNLAYLQTPFEFYANITRLDYLDIEQTILEVLKATKKNTVQ